jgi:hypothetical protein
MLQDQDTTIIDEEWQKIITDFYKNINSKNIKDIKQFVDTNLQKSNTFRTYFNEKRLTRFINSIDWIKIENIEESDNTNETKKSFNYNITYSLLNDNTKKYKEDRTISLIKKWETYKISKIRCSTIWCSRMPFFNPWKYDIK